MSRIKIAALGGMSENGKNMYLVTIDDQIFVLDAGLIYPDIDVYGVDAVVPDISYLVNNKDKIKGIFLSHGHEDHIGSIPYLLKNINAPIYGTNFTIALVEETISSNGLKVKDYHLYKVNPNKKLKFGNVIVYFISVNHSLPDSACIVIQSPDGNIVYAPDFNFSVELNKNYRVAYDKLLALTEHKCLAVLAESIGISDDNRPDNDTLFENTVYNEIAKVKGAVYVVCYSTDVARIQKIINMSTSHNKKIGFIGGKGEQLVSMAIKTGYLMVDEKDKIQASTPNDERLTFIVGNYTEPYYLLNRIIKGQMKNIKITKDDLIITLSTPLVGTTKFALSVVDEIYRNNLKIINIDKNQFRTSHATKTDLNQLYKITNPEYIIPIKGEERHLDRHYKMLKQLELSDKILDIRDGKVVEILNGKYNKTEQIKIGKVYVDGSLTGAVDDEIIKERDMLAQHGIIIITTYVDLKTKTIIKEPNIITKGFAYNKLTDEKTELLKEITKKTINNSLAKKKLNLEQLEDALTYEIKKHVLRIAKEEVSILTPIISIK